VYDLVFCMLTLLMLACERFLYIKVRCLSLGAPSVGSKSWEMLSKNKLVLGWGTAPESSECWMVSLGFEICLPLLCILLP